MKSEVLTYTAYDEAPPRPSGEEHKHIRIVCISDTHGETFPVPEGDVLIHAGDLTALGEVEDLEKTVDWLCGLPHKVKIIIGGNHDLPLDEQSYLESKARLKMPFGADENSNDDARTFRWLLTNDRAQRAGMIYLQHSTCTFKLPSSDKEWRVYGSPSSPSNRAAGAFIYRRDLPENTLYSSIPPSTDIVITHTPPHGILDAIEIPPPSSSSSEPSRIWPLGCKPLYQRISEIRPLLHVFGHIHETHGVLTHTWIDSPGTENENKATTFVNAACEPTGRGIKRLQQRLGIENTVLETGRYPFQPIIVDILNI